MFKRKMEDEEGQVLSDAASLQHYAENAEKSTVKYNAFLETCEKLNLGKRALDIGIGPGVLAVLLAQKFPDLQITGLDLAPQMIKVGEQYVEGKGLADRISFVQGDASDAAFMESLGQFDFIYSTFTLHHLPEPETVIKILCNARADEGTVFLYDLRRAWWLYWIPSQRGFFKSVRGSYTRPEVEAILRKADVADFTVKNVFPFLLSALIPGR